MGRFDEWSQKWGFYLGLILVSFFLPIQTAVPFDRQNTSLVMIEGLKYGLAPYTKYASIFHIMTVLCVIWLFIAPKTGIRAFYGYMGINFVAIAFMQNIVDTPSYGHTILYGNMFLALVLAFYSFRSALVSNELVELIIKDIPKRCWLLSPLAIFAFWSPADPAGNPDFNVAKFVTSDFGLAVCFTIPVFIFLLMLFYPHINRPMGYSICTIGLYFGILNILGPLTMPGYPLWMVVLHLPLFIMSIYGLVMLKRKDPAVAIEMLNN